MPGVYAAKTLGTTSVMTGFIRVIHILDHHAASRLAMTPLFIDRRLLTRKVIYSGAPQTRTQSTRIGQSLEPRITGKSPSSVIASHGYSA